MKSVVENEGKLSERSKRVRTSSLPKLSLETDHSPEPEDYLKHYQHNLSSQLNQLPFQPLPSATIYPNTLKYLPNENTYHHHPITKVSVLSPTSSSLPYDVTLPVSRDGTPRRWSPDEDDRLTQAVKMFGEVDWKINSDFVGTRDNVQCRQRWQKVLRPGLQKGKWSKEEDKLLVELIQTYEDDWAAIASNVAGRSSKQCRERWHHHLSPNVNTSIMTPEEDEKLLILHKKHGNSWSKIAREMPGRTENMVRSRIHMIIRTKAEAALIESHRNFQAESLTSHGVDISKLNNSANHDPNYGIKRVSTLSVDSNHHVASNTFQQLLHQQAIQNQLLHLQQINNMNGINPLTGIKMDLSPSYTMPYYTTRNGKTSVNSAISAAVDSNSNSSSSIMNTISDDDIANPKDRTSLSMSTSVNNKKVVTPDESSFKIMEGLSSESKEWKESKDSKEINGNQSQSSGSNGQHNQSSQVVSSNLNILSSEIMKLHNSYQNLSQTWPSLASQSGYMHMLQYAGYPTSFGYNPNLNNIGQSQTNSNLNSSYLSPYLSLSGLNSLSGISNLSNINRLGQQPNGNGNSNGGNNNNSNNNNYLSEHSHGNISSYNEGMSSSNSSNREMLMFPSPMSTLASMATSTSVTGKRKK